MMAIEGTRDDLLEQSLVPHGQDLGHGWIDRVEILLDEPVGVNE